MLMFIKLLKYYVSLFYWEKASLQKVKKMQIKKFRKIFEHARKYSKFYKDIYTQYGVMDLKIKNFEDIKKVPVINKAMLRKYSARDIMTTNISEQHNKHSTSGSSGEPFVLYSDKFTDYTSHVRVYFILKKIARYNPFMKITMITRYEKNEQFQVEKDLSFLSKLQKKLGLFQREIISIYEDPEVIIEKIIHSKPHILWSTPSVMEVVANKLKEKDLHLRIPYLYFTSEHLNPGQIKKFNDYISKNIVDIYGAMESPSLGYEYNSSGKRMLFPNSNFFELHDAKDYDGEKYGKTVITNLLNFTMPIIRYDLNDLCEIKDEPEVPYKYIGNIIGRADDILEFPDGSKFVHHHAYEMFMDFEECDHYKFEQKGKETIKLLLKPNKKYSNEEIKAKAIDRWNKRFKKYPLEIEFVTEFVIDPKTGKFKNIEKK